MSRLSLRDYFAFARTNELNLFIFVFVEPKTQRMTGAQSNSERFGLAFVNVVKKLLAAQPKTP